MNPFGLPFRILFYSKIKYLQKSRIWFLPGETGVKPTGRIPPAFFIPKRKEVNQSARNPETVNLKQEEKSNVIQMMKLINRHHATLQCKVCGQITHPSVKPGGGFYRGSWQYPNGCKKNRNFQVSNLKSLAIAKNPNHWRPKPNSRKVSVFFTHSFY